MKKLFILLFFLLTTTMYAQLDLYHTLIEYEKYCYADSSEQIFLMYVGQFDNDPLVDTAYVLATKTNTIDPGIDPNYRGGVTRIVHRNPDWNGFKAFIKLKYKQLLEVQYNSLLQRIKAYNNTIAPPDTNTTNEGELK